MPRMRKGWDDYIPAKGEARVLAELKGSYGGKSMYRNRRRRGAFRGTQRRERYWVPFYNSDSTGPALESYHVPRQILRVTPLGPNPDYISVDNTQFFGNSQARLLMMQGSIPVWLNLNDRAMEDWAAGPGSREVPMVHLFYYWMKTRGDMDYGSSTGGDPAEGASVGGKYVWSNAPGNLGNLYKFLQRKDIIQWGHRTLRPINPQGVRASYNGTGTAFYGWPMDPFTKGQVSYLPLPRMGKRGYTFAPGDELKLYAVPVPYDFAHTAGAYGGYNQLTLSDNPDDPGATIFVQPMVRGLFAK